jgi:hypothetical protein
MNLHYIRVLVSSTTFTTHSSGTYGGVFYLASIGQLTMTSVTATGFDAPASGNGRFFYFSGPAGIDPTFTITSSTFTCSSTALTSATV